MAAPSVGPVQCDWSKYSEQLVQELVEARATIAKGDLGLDTRQRCHDIFTSLFTFLGPFQDSIDHTLTLDKALYDCTYRLKRLNVEVEELWKNTYFRGFGMIADSRNVNSAEEAIKSPIKIPVHAVNWMEESRALEAISILRSCADRFALEGNSESLQPFAETCIVIFSQINDHVSQIKYVFLPGFKNSYVSELVKRAGFEEENFLTICFKTWAYLVKKDPNLKSSSKQITDRISDLYRVLNPREDVMSALSSSSVSVASTPGSKGTPATPVPSRGYISLESELEGRLRHLSPRRLPTSPSGPYSPIATEEEKEKPSVVPGAVYKAPAAAPVPGPGTERNALLGGNENKQVGIKQDKEEPLTVPGAVYKAPAAAPAPRTGTERDALLGGNKKEEDDDCKCTLI